MIDPAPAKSLPLWMQVTAFAGSLILAALRVLDYFKKPTLYVHATRDIFFRLIDMGESLFCNAVLLASDGAILVRDVSLVLKRIDKGGGPRKAEKQFPLLVVQHGEKVPGTKVSAEHMLFGSSPLQYLEQSKPYRAIYICVQREYQDRQKKAISDFSTAMENFRLGNVNTTEEDAPGLRVQFTGLIDAHYNVMVPLIQIEAGDYQLEITVTYECVGWRFLGARKMAQSRLEFSVDEQLLEKWKVDLKNTLSTRGQQIVSQKFADVIYPQLDPLAVVESTKP